jgi:hypothetical protein
MISDTLVGTKNRLSDDTTNIFVVVRSHAASSSCEVPMSILVHPGSKAIKIPKMKSMPPHRSTPRGGLPIHLPQFVVPDFGGQGS